MIDNSCFIINDFSNKEFDNLTTRLNVDCPINSDKLKFKHENLMIKYFPNDNKLKIINSLHCFYNAVFDFKKQPVNYDDFTFWKFQVVTEYLTKILIERPQEDFKVSTNFEVGFNIQLNHSPWEVMSRYLSCVTTATNAFYAVPDRQLKGKPIEVMCHQSDYKLKFYDKSKQASLPYNNLMRYEIVYTQLRKIRNVFELSKNSDLSLKSINSKDSWDNLYRHLIKMYDSIKKIPILQDDVSEVEIFAMHEYCNLQLSNDIQRIMNKNTFKKRRAEKKRIYDSLNLRPENVHTQIRKQIINKYTELISVPEFQGL